MRTTTHKPSVCARKRKASGPDTSLSFGTYAYRAIRKHFKKSTKYEAAVLKDRDPEPLHQMRVGMRRLRTAMLVFAPALDLPKAASRPQISKIAKRLGNVRDLDVMQIWFQRYMDTTALPPAEARQVEQILGSLERRRSKQFSHMQAMLKGERYQIFVQTFHDWLEHPAYQSVASLPILDVLPDLLSPLISQLLLHPGWLVGTTVKQGQHRPSVIVSAEPLMQYLEQKSSAIHELRKHIKGVRYQTEFFVEFYDPPFKTQTQEFREIQDLLGELQDGVVLSEFLGHQLGDYWPNMLPTLVDYLTHQRHHLWQQWQTKQQQYLDPDFRRALRQQILHPTLPDASN